MEQKIHFSSISIVLSTSRHGSVRPAFEKDLQRTGFESEDPSWMNLRLAPHNLHPVL